MRLHKLPYIMRREFGTNHLHKLLVWDFCACFVSLSVVVLAFAATDSLREHMEPWQVMGAICWFRIIYSVTTFPFLLFRLPVLSLVLSHARPTGYTRNGKCVPKLKTWPWYSNYKHPPRRKSALFQRPPGALASDAAAPDATPASPT